MAKKIIIIGAGPAGLTAALELTKSDKKYDVTVLEALDQVGGISKTLLHNKNRMDIGGHRFFSKEDKVMDWWFDILKIQGKPSKDDIILKAQKPFEMGGPDPEKQDEVMLIRRRISRIYYLKKFFDYPVSLKFQTLANMGFVKTIKVGFSYLASMMKKIDPEVTLEDFMINRFGKVLYSMFFENYTEKVWGKHPSQLSAEWGAQRIKGLSITKILKDMLLKPFKKKSNDIRQKEVETSLIEQFFYPKYGPGQLWETVAKKYEQNGGSLIMNSNITKIEVDNNQIVSIECDNGTKYEADTFISTMPIKDLIQSMPSEKMNPQVRKDAIELPYRDFITVGLLVDKLKITNKSKIKTVGDIVPDCWIYIQEQDVKIGRLQIFNNWSPYMLEDPQNSVWIGLEYFCDEGDKLWNMSDDEFINFAIQELDKIGIIEKDSVKDSVRANIQKAYPSYFGSYDRFDDIREYLDSYDNLYCIGRNGQHRYNNMDHSMMTAFNAVEDINSDGSLGKEYIWNVNTDEEYHEEKE